MEQVARLVEAIRPEIVWVVYDVLFYLLHAKNLKEARHRAIQVLYCPIDGCKPEADWLARLEDLDRLVLFTNAAKATVLEVFPLKASIAVAPHGVDTGIFSKVDRGFARRAIFGDRQDLADAFIVLNANRNNWRKRIDLTLEGVARFAEHKHDAFLCLHMDRRNDLDPQKAASRYGVEGKVVYTANGAGHPSFTPERLNLLYNASDVGINTSRGEGWG